MALTEALALELTPQGVNVNAICPGAIDTDMSQGTKDSGQLEQLLLRIPKGRLGQPEDIASMIVWLLDPTNDWVTGQVFGVDGGLGTLRGR